MCSKGVLVRMRLDYGPEPVKPKIEPFFINTEDHAGFSVLMIAASWDMIDVVTALLDLGCKVEHKNRYGHTAFTWACTVGHAEVVKTLLFHGANIHHKTLEGRSGLHYACLYLKARVVSCLLDYLFEKFSNYRVQHAKAEFDATRWTRYATMLEQYLDLQDNNSKRAWELLPIPPPGHLVFDGAAALAKEDAARRERKRLRRQKKQLAAQLLEKGIAITPEMLAVQAAENAANEARSEKGSHTSASESESDDDGYSSNAGGSDVDSDEEDRREQAEAKANDPEHKAILAELARVAAVVEGREDARPVVTPSQPQVGALSVQEKEMMEAAKRKRRRRSKSKEVVIHLCKLRMPLLLPIMTLTSLRPLFLRTSNTMHPLLETTVAMSIVPLHPYPTSTDMVRSLITTLSIPPSIWVVSTVTMIPEIYS